MKESAAVSKRIVVSRDTRTFIMDAYKCKEKAVWAALNFRTDSPLARRIRSLALQRGGVLVDGNTPKAEPVYDTANNTMMQSISDSVVIVVNFTDGTACLLDSGKVVDKLITPSIEDFMQLQQQAQKLAESRN
ncbi:hypothetical protein [uncultured Muribaculum sp.]|uniref:hypothetical protein n=1 Tax=uncultured Muribaculum sp. TaxID=1918613 RepID=UPI0025B4AF61|nr:hypothetical protein [uncultured Muribaculum sp.]